MAWLVLAEPSTVFGPLALSLGDDLTGSYRQILLILLVVPATGAVAGFLVSVPERPQRAPAPGQLR